MPYALRLLETLLAGSQRVHLVYSQAAQIVSKQELELTLPGRAQDAEKVLKERLGEFSGERTPRLEAVAQALEATGATVEIVSSDAAGAAVTSRVSPPDVAVAACVSSTMKLARVQGAPANPIKAVFPSNAFLITGKARATYCSRSFTGLCMNDSSLENVMHPARSQSPLRGTLPTHAS